MGITRVESWLVNRLTAAFDGKGTDKTTLEMPPFQRGVVWSPTKQADLIRSLKSGFPIGSLLFYRRLPDESGRVVNLLIDGLQRTTAIRNYRATPLAFMDLEDLDPKSVASFCSTLVAETGGKALQMDTRDALSMWMSETKTLNAKDGFDAIGLIEAMNAKLIPSDPMPIKNVLTDAARALIEQISRTSDISAIEIPVLFYEGPESNLPEIFEKINATGTKLSKYEIFAASWVSQEIHVQNNKVLFAISQRYSKLMSEENITINGVRADGMPHQLSLFDYLFGLGKVLSDRFPLLFGANEDPTSMASVAFSLATVCSGLPIAKMRSLPDRMDRDAQGRLDPSNFEEALLESAEFVNSTLTPFIGLKLNSDRPGSGAHTDLQIASMVARAFVGTYVPSTWEEREGSFDDRSRLRVKFPQHYLVDVLQQSWRGSGDNRLYSMVWERGEPDSSESPMVPARHYLRAFDNDEFDRTLEQWYGDQVRLNQRSRAYVTAPVKAFLKFVYSGVVTVMDESKERFELDHVFPVSRLVDRAKSDEDGWPISAVSNLALFDWQTNREKSKLDIVQYLARVDDSERPKRRESITKYLLVAPEEAAIPLDEAGNDQLEREMYLQFLRYRFDVMKVRVTDALGIT